MKPLRPLIFSAFLLVFAAGCSAGGPGAQGPVLDPSQGGMVNPMAGGGDSGGLPAAAPEIGPKADGESVITEDSTPPINPNDFAGDGDQGGGNVNPPPPPEPQPRPTAIPRDPTAN